MLTKVIPWKEVWILEIVTCSPEDANLLATSIEDVVKMKKPWTVFRLLSRARVTVKDSRVFAKVYFTIQNLHQTRINWWVLDAQAVRLHNTWHLQEAMSDPTPLLVYPSEACRQARI